MKNLFTLLCAGLAGMLAACETILPVEIPEDERWGITLNAVASPETNFKAYVTRCYPNTEAPEYKYPYYIDNGHWVPNPVLHYLYSMLYKYYEGSPVPFNTEKNYGYSTYSDREAFEEAFLSLYEREILPAIGKGLQGTVYTQLFDVEDETNGLYTYDRQVCKVTPERMRGLAERLYQAAAKEAKEE